MGDTQDEVEGDSLSDFYVLQEQGDAVQEISEAGPPFSHCDAMRRTWGGSKGGSNKQDVSLLGRRDRSAEVYGGAPRVSSSLSGDWQVGQRPQLGNDAD